MRSTDCKENKLFCKKKVAANEYLSSRLGLNLPDRKYDNHTFREPRYSSQQQQQIGHVTVKTEINFHLSIGFSHLIWPVFVYVCGYYSQTGSGLHWAASVGSGRCRDSAVQ